MFKRIVSTILTLLLLAAMAPAVLAAELPSIDDPQVFIKQSRSSGTCTLASAAMMLRSGLFGLVSLYPTAGYLKRIFSYGILAL